MAAPATKGLKSWTIPGTNDDFMGLGVGDDPEAGGEAEPASPEPDDSSFYALLNLPRDADEEAVRRAYRSLAAACHPDKVAAELRDAATEQFGRLQRAYEVLSDPDKRSVYDIYGAAGLEAGLELADKLAGPDDLKRQWAAFRAREAAAALEARVAHRGAYVVRVDATEGVGVLNGAAAKPAAAAARLLSAADAAPEVAGMAMSTQVQVPLGEAAAATLGGQVGVRRGAGGGAVVAGVRRVLDAATCVDAHAQVGLRTLLAASSTRQLSDRLSAGLALSFQPSLVREAAAAGADARHAFGGALGVTVTSGRRLGEGTDADAVWTVGPAAASGAAVGLTHRTGNVTLGGRVEVGLAGAGAAAVSARVGWRPGGGPTAVRLAARVHPGGAEVEVGASRRVSDVAVIGCGLAAGTGGVVLKPRFARGGHTFEVPVLLARGGPAGPDPADLPGVAAALLGPPAAAALAHWLLVRPLARATSDRAARLKRAAAAGEVRAVLAGAGRTAAALRAVGERRARREAASPPPGGGLVIVRARYGPPAALDADDAELRAAAAAALVAERGGGGGGSEDDGEGDAAFASAGSSSGDGGSPAASAAASSAAAAAPPASLAGVMAAPAPHPDAIPDEALVAAGAVVDVTPAVRLLVEGGRLALGGRVPRPGLLGFCDPAPGEAKALSVRYVHRGVAHLARIPDGSPVSLPERGTPLPPGTAEAVAVCRAAEALRGGGGGGGG